MMQEKIHKILSGIYEIKCSINNKVYIGRSTNIPARFQNHMSLLNYGNHNNKIMQEDCNKYGITSFEFKILKIIRNRKELFEEEIKAIQSVDRDSLYNVANAPKKHGKKKQNEIEQYLSNNAGKVMLMQPDRQELIEKINLRNPANNRLLKSRLTLNAYLEEIGSEYIIKEFETSRTINGKTKRYKTAWKIISAPPD